MLAWAATDNFGLTDPGAPPVGAGRSVSSAAPIVRGGLGARPFFLRAQSELRSGPPLAFGSAAFLNALAEVRSLAVNRTAAQVAMVRKWVPFSGVVFNGIADDLIDRDGRSELDAAARSLTPMRRRTTPSWPAQSWLLDPRTHDAGNVSVGPGITAPTGSYTLAIQCYTAAGAVNFPAGQTVQPGDGGWAIRPSRTVAPVGCSRALQPAGDSSCHETAVHR